MNDTLRPPGFIARALLTGLFVGLAGVSFAAATAPATGAAQPRDPAPAEPESDRSEDEGGDRRADADRGFVVGVEAGSGLLWDDRFVDRPREAMAGFTLGYDLGALRLEAEVLGRATEAGDRADRRGSGHGFGRGGAGLGGMDALLGGFGGGVSGLEQEIGQLFLNLYYDFETGSRVTPWIGVGGGWATTEVEYDVLSPPLPYPPPGAGADFPAFPFPSGAVEFDDSDSVPGVQLLMGADVRMSRSFFLGVKVRWSRFGRATFAGSGTGFDDFAELLAIGLGAAPGEEPGPDEMAEIFARSIGGFFAAAAHPFSIALGGVAATLSVSYRF